MSVRYRVKLPKGSLTAKVTVREHRIGKETTLSDEANVIGTKFVHVPKGFSVGVVSIRNGVTLSMGYQSARIDIGGDLPYPMRPGNMDDFEEGLDVLESYVDDQLVRKARGLKALLKKMGQ